MPRFHVRSARIEEAKRLRRLRSCLQLSQRELAGEFKVGSGAISFWESGMRTIPGPVLKLIEIYEHEAGLPPPAPAKKDQRQDIKHIKGTWLSRNLGISVAVLQIAGRIAGASLQRLWGGGQERPVELAADKLGSTLGQLKGPLMKFGQLMSYADVGLPEAARERLADLQDSSAPLDSARIRAIVSAELGPRAELLLAGWEDAPVGVGSIGQVHRVRLPDGRQLAVKVQYPEIRRLVGADLKNTKPFEILSPVLLGRREGAPLFDELRDRFTLECDYAREARFQEVFRHSFQGDSEIHIPAVVPELSGERVLAFEFAEGKRFRELSKRGSREERNLAGQAIFRMVFTSIFKLGIANCDPNPGNFLFSPGRVSFLDFGCVKELDESLVSTWRRYFKAVLDDDQAAARELLVEMGYVVDPDAFDFKFHHELMRLICKPWIERGPFRFDRAYVTEIWVRLTRENVNLPRLRLPRDWLFVNRLQWGLYSVLAELESEADWGSTLRPLLD